MIGKIIKTSPSAPNRHIIEEAARIMRMGGVVIYPTDTVYGIGAIITDEEAINKIKKLKRRPTKPFPIIVASQQEAENIAVLNSRARKLIREFWPGPLTIKLHSKIELSSSLVDEEGKVAVRLPDHKIPILIAEELGGYLVGTSANRSGSPSPVTAEEALRELEEVDLVIDTGPTPYRSPSTIIDVTTTPPVIIRIGAIEPQEIEDVLDEEVRILSRT